jgi:hypothetical protein
LAFSACGLLAYGVVFILSPGYIFSGYRFRLVPFTAFHTLVFYGAFFALLISVALGVPGQPRTGRRAHTAWHSLNRGIAVTLALLMSVYWVGMQYRYVQLFPPDHFAVFQRLQSPPFRGASFAAAAYAAPIAAYTGQWAYMDGTLNEAITQTRDAAGKRVLQQSRDYLWFADRDMNPAYRRPQYYLCLALQTMPAVAERLSGNPDVRITGCESSPLVRLAQSPEARQAVPSPRLVEIDTSGRDKVGFARWAILELRWP